MSALSVLSSHASSIHSVSQHSLISNNVLSPSPGPFASGGSSSSSSSSRVSLDRADDENATITFKPAFSKGKQKSCDDLQLLAVSTRITELSYSISDIQTRIFEIQELRHKSQSSGDLSSATSVIDQSLMALDERLDAVAQGVKAVGESLAPLSANGADGTDDTSERALLLRKHAAFAAEWAAVQEESDVLREELKEDKWLTVFRTVTDQADGMMTSLEKAVNRCQEFIWQVHRYRHDDSQSQSSSMASVRSDKSPLSLDVFQSLLDSFEAKKKHYMPATTKVLSIIDKGVQDRVTKNGECLRRHAESTQRWKNLRERISRTDTDMENVRRILISGEIAPSESGSTTSGPTSKSKSRSGFLTPQNGSGSGSSKKSKGNGTLSRSMSPLRKFARKLTGSGKNNSANVTPAAKLKKSPPTAPSTEPVPTLRHRGSVFNIGASQPSIPATPGHKYSHSLTPESSPSTSRRVIDYNKDITVKGRSLLNRQPWNSSTKVEPEQHTMKLRRPSFSGSTYQRTDIPPVPINSSPYKRSSSRSSMASSRPWSPVTSSVSTAPSSGASRPQHYQSPSQTFHRPPSRTHGTPRPRPQTPTKIPGPSDHWRSGSEAGWDDDDGQSTSLMQRALSPSFSSSAVSTSGRSSVGPRCETPGGTRLPTARPPSRSMIPAPVFQFSSPSRSASALSEYRDDSPPMSTVSSFRSSAMRAQTPEAMLRSRAQQVPFYQGSQQAQKTVRPGHKLPPSSFRDGSSPRTPSRPSSRASVYTPGLEANPTFLYTPGNPRDPLDAEVAAIVNSIAHGLLVERIDPPLRAVPKEGEEIRAQYAFSTTLARKIVTCRLATLSRNSAKGESSTTTKKVMVRIGGGWQDLQFYMLNRQAGL